MLSFLRPFQRHLTHFLTLFTSKINSFFFPVIFRPCSLKQFFSSQTLKLAKLSLLSHASLFALLSAIILKSIVPGSELFVLKSIRLKEITQLSQCAITRSNIVQYSNVYSLQTLSLLQILRKSRHQIYIPQPNCSKTTLKCNLAQ